MIHFVQLEQFEGPMELLLFLFREQELDITEVPIAQITDEYLRHLQASPRLNIEQAAEFLLMAVVLIRLKMRSLLPRPLPETLETGATVTMDEIAAEFQRYRQAAGLLEDMAERQRSLFPRAGRAAPADEPEADVQLLTQAFQAIIARLANKEDWTIEPVQLHIEEAIGMLRALLARGAVVDLLSYLRQLPSIKEIIITFLAALELARLGELRVTQDPVTETIRLYPRRPSQTLLP
ncbi:MAG: ScpA family protein [candidate division WOR-3 bacterium]